jgi:hypothetical protein
LDEKREERRAEFLTVRGANPEAVRLQLQKIAPSLLDWLRRYDAEWLEEHLPPANKPVPPPVRVDWENWDVRLVEAVETAVAQIKQIAGCPVRVSLTAITKQVGHRAWFEKKLDRLPLTARAVSKHVESFEDYLLRRVRWAEDYYRAGGIVPTRHKLEVLAGTRGRRGKTQKVRDAIDVALKSLADQSG